MVKRGCLSALSVKRYLGDDATLSRQSTRNIVHVGTSNIAYKRCQCANGSPILFDDKAKAVLVASRIKGP